MGQAKSALLVMVTLDGGAAMDVPLEILYSDGSNVQGKTGAAGFFEAPYGPTQYGPAIVRISPPPGVEDIGEGTAQPAELTAAGVKVSFALTSRPAADSAKRPDSTTVALVTAALLVAVGISL